MHEHEEEGDDDCKDAEYRANVLDETVKSEIMAVEQRLLAYQLVFERCVAFRPRHVGQPKWFYLRGSVYCCRCRIVANSVPWMR